MKAFTYDYSLPGNVTWTESAPEPKLHIGFVMIDVLHAGLNPLEYKLPSIGVLKWGKNKKPVGSDVVGRVCAVGGSVNEFSIGDLVFGSALGSVAEKAICLPQLIRKIPEDTDLCNAAGLPLAGLTAIQALRAGKVLKAKNAVKILVLGASGGVGHLVVQLAKALNPVGTVVVGVCSYRNKKFVKSLGADEVFDYTAEGFDVSALVHDCDALIDCVQPEFNYEPTAKACLKKGGIYVSLDVSNSKRLLRSIMQKMLPCCRVEETGFRQVLCDHNLKDLITLRDLLVGNKLQSHVSKKVAFTAQGMQEAFDDLKSHRTVGKMVVMVKECAQVGCSHVHVDKFATSRENFKRSASSIVEEKKELATESAVKASVAKPDPTVFDSIVQSLAAPVPPVEEIVEKPVAVSPKNSVKRSGSYLVAAQEGLTKPSTEFDNPSVDPAKISVALKPVKVPTPPATPKEEPVVELPKPKRSSTYLAVVEESLVKSGSATPIEIVKSPTAASVASAKRSSTVKVVEETAVAVSPSSSVASAKRSSTVKVVEETAVAVSPSSSVTSAQRSSTVKVVEEPAVAVSPSSSVASAKRSSTVKLGQEITEDFPPLSVTATKRSSTVKLAQESEIAPSSASESSPKKSATQAQETIEAPVSTRRSSSKI